MPDDIARYTIGARLAYAARTLTVVRLLVAIVSLFGRGVFLFADMLVRSFGAVIQLFARSLRRTKRASSGRDFVRDMEAIVAESARRGVRAVREEVRSVRPPTVSRRTVAFRAINFALTLCVVMVPIFLYSQWRSLDSTKDRVLSKTMTAVSSLFSAAGLLGEQKLPEAGDAFSTAAGNFIDAKEELSEINGLLLEIARFIPSDSARQAGASRHILEAGELSGKLGERLTAAMVAPAGQTATVDSFLSNFITQAERALPDARRLEDEIRRIDPLAVPVAYRDQFADIASKASYLPSSLEEAITLARQASIFLGEQMDKRYLLVFQNNSEIRGSGGFIGSFALVDVSRGEIKNLIVPKGGSYDTKAGLTRLVAAPDPLRLLNPLWHFWDANWWPDWPTSARKLQWFYENSNGPTVDGVISLTPDVIERLLAVTGPIDMTKEYGVTMTAENFWQVTQTFSEQKPHVTTEPKKIIGDLMTKILEELPKRLTPETTIKLVEQMEASLNEKYILAYFNDPDLQASVERFGWGGSVAKADGDYLMVVNANIGGQKTDRVVRQTLRHDAKILPDGSIIDTLTIIREHTGIKNELFTGVRNVDWLRVYVPEGSELISASGFSTPDASYFQEADSSWELDPDLASERKARTDEASGTRIYSEQGKTVFANWTMIDPGETGVTTFAYKLPFTVSQPEPSDWFDSLLRLFKKDEPLRYRLLVQKQPGAQPARLETSLMTSLPVVWNYPPEARQEQGVWRSSSDLNVDIVNTYLFAQ